MPRISTGTALRTAALLVSFVIELLAAANFLRGMPQVSAFYHDIERAGQFARMSKLLDDMRSSITFSRESEVKCLASCGSKG